MARSRTPVPSYRLHKSSGQAVVTVRSLSGRKQDIYLGVYGTAESRAEYARVVARILHSGPATASPPPNSDLSVNELLVAFLKHARGYYAHPDGTPTSEYRDFLCSVRPLRDLYGTTLAAEFGPLALKTVRQKMVDDGISRKVVNQRVGRLKRIFKWAVAEEMVPVAVFHALSTVAGLRMGRSSARETDPVVPVADDVVEATLPHMTPTLAAMVQFQRLTGCRPGEACRLRPVDIDRSEAVWVYRPRRHKGSHRGKSRAILIGPKAQAVIETLLAVTGAEEVVFSPVRSRFEWFSARRAKRKSKVQPSQMYRVKPAEERVRNIPSVFTAQSFSKAIAKACERGGIESWQPNQLRHAHGTEVRKRYGLEAAQVTLGHAKADVTQVYAERDMGLAAKVAAEIG